MNLKNTYHTLGVVNITPNSFSDGNKFKDENYLSQFFKQNNIFFDIGAESTAPFNDPISFKEEVERLKSVMHFIKDVEANKISIDTYRPETIRWFIDEFGSDNIIWNDVSGCLDEEVIAILQEYTHLNYVYSHNLAPSRALCSFHMDYLDDDINLSQYFKLGLESLGRFKERIIFDPCFGFSKTKEQNLNLLKDVSSILGGHGKWMIGISKKSFLQSLCHNQENREKRLEESEVYHQKFLESIISSCENRYSGLEIYFRVHDTNIVSRCINAVST